MSLKNLIKEINDLEDQKVILQTKLDKCQTKTVYILNRLKGKKIFLLIDNKIRTKFKIHRKININRNKLPIDLKFEIPQEYSDDIIKSITIDKNLNDEYIIIKFFNNLGSLNESGETTVEKISKDELVNEWNELYGYCFGLNKEKCKLTPGCNYKKSRKNSRYRMECEHNKIPLAIEETSNPEIINYK